MSATMKALKAYAADLSGLDFPAIQVQIKGESDRAAIVILCAFLEDKLEKALRKIIEPRRGNGATNKMFGYNGALGTFSSRIDVAHGFGVIDSQTCKQIHVLRELRNACAHSPKEISFAVKELKGASELFARGENSFHVDIGNLIEKVDLRLAVTVEVALLGAAISQGSRAASLSRFKEAMERVKNRKGQVAKSPD